MASPLRGHVFAWTLGAAGALYGGAWRTQRCSPEVAARLAGADLAVREPAVYIAVDRVPGDGERLMVPVANEAPITRGVPDAVLRGTLRDLQRAVPVYVAASASGEVESTWLFDNEDDPLGPPRLNDTEHALRRRQLARRLRRQRWFRRLVHQLARLLRTPLLLLLDEQRGELDGRVRHGRPRRGARERKPATSLSGGVNGVKERKRAPRFRLLYLLE